MSPRRTALRPTTVQPSLAAAAAAWRFCSSSSASNASVHSSSCGKRSCHGLEGTALGQAIRPSPCNACCGDPGPQHGTKQNRRSPACGSVCCGSAVVHESADAGPVSHHQLSRGTCSQRAPAASALHCLGTTPCAPQPMLRTQPRASRQAPCRECIINENTGATRASQGIQQGNLELRYERSSSAGVRSGRSYLSSHMACRAAAARAQGSCPQMPPAAPSPALLPSRRPRWQTSARWATLRRQL